jgi:hypothetical protein
MCGSSDRVPASPELKPQSHQKEKKSEDLDCPPTPTLTRAGGREHSALLKKEQ